MTKKEHKTPLTNPELCVPGQKCKILLPTRWIGANCSEPNVWLSAKIKEVYLDKNDNKTISGLVVDVRASHKYNTVRVENMLSLRNQFDTIIF